MHRCTLAGARQPQLICMMNGGCHADTTQVRIAMHFGIPKLHRGVVLYVIQRRLRFFPLLCVHFIFDFRCVFQPFCKLCCVKALSKLLPCVFMTCLPAHILEHVSFYQNSFATGHLQSYLKMNSFWFVI